MTAPVTKPAARGRNHGLVTDGLEPAFPQIRLGDRDCGILGHLRRNVATEALCDPRGLVTEPFGDNPHVDPAWRAAHDCQVRIYDLPT